MIEVHPPVEANHAAIAARSLGFHLTKFSHELLSAYLGFRLVVVLIASIVSTNMLSLSFSLCVLGGGRTHIIPLS